jgi:hypothetical protein
LAAYVQGGELNQYDVADCLRRSGLAIGNYQIRDLQTLVRLSFLLSGQTRDFITGILSQLHSLRASTFRRYLAFDNQVRGAINWSQTVPLQVTRPCTYVCADAQRSFDLPENRMLAFLVERHLQYLGKLLEGPSKSANRGIQKGWWEDLHRLREAIFEIRSNPYYRLIPRTPGANGGNLPGRLVARVRRRRSRLSAVILAHYLHHQNVCGDAPDLRAVHQVLVDGLRWPEENKLFELFALFALVDMLRRGAMVPPTVVPIAARTGGDRWFASLRGENEVRVNVYYQTFPGDLMIQYSAHDVDATIRDYVRVLIDHGDKLGMLRPDVVIDCERGRERRLLLIEVKRSNLLTTIRRGLRELVDYRHLIRPRETSVWNTEIRGLLCVKEWPAKRLRPGPPFSHGYAITTTRRMLDMINCQPGVGELEAMLKFCWFQ